MYLGTIPSASTRADWVVSIDVTDDDTGAAVDLSGATIVVAVREQKSRRQSLLASTANGKVTIQDDGRFQWAFTPSEMGAVCPGTYDIGITVEVDGVTHQLLVGSVAIVDGIVP